MERCVVNTIACASYLDEGTYAQGHVGVAGRVLVEERVEEQAQEGGAALLVHPPARVEWGWWWMDDSRQLGALCEDR